ncbi:MAG: hypothetical protein M0R76_12560 [Proteobacteria bacterium]|nr:hypothetical protein [Pseudomonadota bacterium]
MDIEIVKQRFNTLRHDICDFFQMQGKKVRSKTDEDSAFQIYPFNKRYSLNYGVYMKNPDNKSQRNRLIDNFKDKAFVLSIGLDLSNIQYSDGKMPDKNYKQAAMECEKKAKELQSKYEIIPWSDRSRDFKKILFVEDFDINDEQLLKKIKNKLIEMMEDFDPIIAKAFDEEYKNNEKRIKKKNEAPQTKDTSSRLIGFLGN